MKKDSCQNEIKELLGSIFSKLKSIDNDYYTAGKISLEVPAVKRILKGKTFLQIADVDHDFPKEKIIKIKISEIKLRPLREQNMANFLSDLEDTSKTETKPNLSMG